jgi:protein required for attachment to host cells
MVMGKSLRIWVLVADGGRAQLFVPSEGAPGLRPAALPGLASSAREPKSDRPGHTSASGGTRHTLEPRRDYHKLEKHNFAVALANAVGRAWLAKEFDQLVLVAPPRTVGDLRALLPDRLEPQMRVIPKDMTKAAPSTLWPAVAEILRGTRLAHTH